MCFQCCFCVARRLGKRGIGDRRGLKIGVGDGRRSARESHRCISSKFCGRRDTPPVGEQNDQPKLPGVFFFYELSRMRSCLPSVSRSCTAVSRSRTAIGPWQRGHLQSAGSGSAEACCTTGGRRSRQSGSNLLRLRLASQPK